MAQAEFPPRSWSRWSEPILHVELVVVTTNVSLGIKLEPILVV